MIVYILTADFHDGQGRLVRAVTLSRQEMERLYRIMPSLTGASPRIEEWQTVTVTEAEGSRLVGGAA